MIRLFFSFLFLLGLNQSAAASTLAVHDAGEGLLITLNTDNHAVWIDTGSLLKIRANLESFQPKNKPITDVILTHLHADHSSGIFEIVEKFPGVAVYDNCMPGIAVEDGELLRWTAEFLAKIEKRFCVKEGSELVFDEVQLQFLWPTGVFTSKAHNHYSLVIKITAKEKVILVMGDANKKTERWLLRNQKNRLQHVDVLVVGHHGSNASSSIEFLDFVSPETAVVSVNLNNARGHPSKEALARIASVGANIWVTGRDGDFAVTLD